MGMSLNIKWCARRGDKWKQMREVGHRILAHNGDFGGLEQ